MNHMNLFPFCGSLVLVTLDINQISKYQIYTLIQGVCLMICVTFETPLFSDLCWHTMLPFDVLNKQFCWFYLLKKNWKFFILSMSGPGTSSAWFLGSARFAGSWSSCSPWVLNFFARKPLHKVNFQIFFPKMESTTLLVQHVKGQPGASQKRGVSNVTLIVRHPVDSSNPNIWILIKVYTALTLISWPDWARRQDLRN